MSERSDRPHRAGGSITDLCRACKAVRDHTVMAVDAGGRALRVVCDFCGSQHNYRGGGDEPASVPPPVPARPLAASGVPRARLAPAGQPPHLPRAEEESPQQLAHDSSRSVPQERTAPLMPTTDATSDADLESLLRRILREELGLTSVAPAPKWRGGQLVLRPGREGLQEKVLPVDALFHKVVMIRNKLRTLEQQLNAAELPEDLKLRLQGYISGCYGSLTSFNVLFADEADQFKGSGGD
jgi:hypothetical protein